jgi:WD40 repeat protein/class 3 adenylate cyclase
MPLTSESDGPSSPPSGTVTFLFTDIEGSTRLLERLREQYAVVLGDQRDLLRSAFTKWNGYEIDTQGDSFFVAFPRATDALACVAAAQRALTGHAWPDGAAVRVRMGLHTGEALVARTGYVGLDVNRAARIAAAGHGGQVLLSQTTRDLVYQDLPPGTALRHLGEHQLKDIRFPQPIFQLDLDGLPVEFPALKTLGAEPPPTAGSAPYQGLQFFTEADAQHFFGREALTGRLVELVCGQRFLAVVGASGSGKSSLVRAGLVPALRRTRARDSLPAACRDVRWQVHVLTPTAHPLEALATSLTRGLESVSAAATLLDDLARDPRSLHLFVHRLLHLEERGTQGADRLLLVVDQFEELFTLCRSETERQAFLDNLVTAATAEPGGASVMLTLRADFYEHLAPYPALSQLVARHQAYLGAMSAVELREAIEAPAALGGWTFSPGLVDLMLHDVGADAGRQPEPGALPLLSHALLETWKRRRANLMNLKAYSESGGVRGAIAHTAESLFFQDLTHEQQAIARGIFLRLTELGDGTQDTRRRASLGELFPQGDPRQVEEVLARLADARLITTAESTVEVAHEALIREWPTLRQWLDEDREGLRLHRHLTESAQAWARLNRDPSELYRGTRLAQAREWAGAHAVELNALERDFLAAASTEAERDAAERGAQQRRELEAAQQLAQTQAHAARQLRRRALYLAAVLILALIAAGAAGVFGQRASRNAALANESLSTAQAAQATSAAEAQARATQQRAAEDNFSRSEAQRLAAEANRLLQSGGSSELVALLTLHSLQHKYTPQGDAVLQAAAQLDYPLHILEASQEAIGRVGYAPNGQYVVTSAWDGTVKVWEAQTGLRVRSIDIPGLFGPSAFSPDSQSLLINVAGGPEAGTVLQRWELSGETAVWQTPIPECRMLPLWLDANTVMLGCVDGSIWQLNANTGQQVRQWTFDGSVWAISPDGHYALTDGAGSLQLWDLESGAPALPLPSVAAGPWAFSTDSQYLALGGGGSTISIWDIQAGQELQTFQLGSGPVLGLAFSPDGHYMLTTREGDLLSHLVDLTRGTEVPQFAGQPVDPRAVAFAPDGQTLFTGGADGNARLWSVTPRPEWPVMTGHTEAILGIAIAPDGQSLATGASDATVRLWDLRFGETVRVLTLDGSVNYGTQFSPDGTQLLTASSSGLATLWDAETGEHLGEVDPTGVSDLNNADFSPDGRYFAVAGWSDGEEPPTDAVIIETRSLEVVSRITLTTTNSVWGVDFAPDGRTLVLSGQGLAWLAEVATGEVIRTFAGHEGAVMSARFSPDGQSLVTAGADSTVRIWEVATGQEIGRLTGHNDAVWMALFSPDGTLIATASADGSLRLWGAASGQELRRYVLHTAGVENAVFSPDGRFIASASDDATARMWDADYHDTLRYLCTRLRRDFTDEERVNYGITGQAPSCPPGE